MQTATLGLISFKPETFNLREHFLDTVVCGLMLWAFGGWIAVTNFLKDAPLPEDSQDIPIKQLYARLYTDLSRDLSRDLPLAESVREVTPSEPMQDLPTPPPPPKS